MTDHQEHSTKSAHKRKPYVYLSERMGKWWMDPEMIFFMAVIFGAILLWNYL
jgi:hypothetical protein